jgi:hypothetical protein
MSGLLCFVFFSLIPIAKKCAILDKIHVQEALEMVALCNTFSLEGYFKNSNALLPYGYRKIAESKETPLHNAVRIFKNDKTLVVVFRGTVSETNSWLENVHYMQIPAQNELQIESQKYTYNFSIVSQAAVHSGYVLATAYLWEDLKNILSQSMLQGVTKIILTGHSQGGALAQLFLAQMSLKTNFQHFELTNYSFGSPSIGNQSFSDDYNRRFKNKSFRFVNTSDFVCKLPLNNQTFDLDFKGFKAQVDLEMMRDLAQLGLEILPEEYKTQIDKIGEVSDRLTSQSVKLLVGHVVFPRLMNANFFAPTGKTIYLEPMPNPNKANKSIRRNQKSYQKGLDLLMFGIKQKLDTYQHNNFTYYNALHKHYGTTAYNRLRLQKLPDNK